MPSLAAQAAYDKKMSLYVNTYKMGKDFVKPIALDQFGRLAPESSVALQAVLTGATKKLKKPADRLPHYRRLLMESMSIALVRGNTRILQLFNNVVRGEAIAALNAAVPT